MCQELPSLESKPKKLLRIFHLLAGNSLFVKSIIVSLALTVGYSSTVYFKGDNAISHAAEEVVEMETGVPIHFAKSDNTPAA